MSSFKNGRGIYYLICSLILAFIFFRESLLLSTVIISLDLFVADKLSDIIKPKRLLIRILLNVVISLVLLFIVASLCSYIEVKNEQFWAYCYSLFIGLLFLNSVFKLN